jgi:membrane-associated protease RseP (regulator of RpoE activity)
LGQVYNDAVAAPIQPGSTRRIYGLILIALLILLITIARFWRHIPWSAR